MKTPFLNVSSNLCFSIFKSNNSIHALLSLLLVFTIIHSTGAQSTPPPKNDYDPNDHGFTPRLGLIIVGILISLFIMSSFTVILWGCIDSPFDTQEGSVERSVQRRKGLDLAVIESFPTFDYSAVKNLQIGRGALECAVCLYEFEDDETLRLIPKCDHVFHPECIDAWLNGHTTCPVCRADLAPRPDESVHRGGFELIGQINEGGNYYHDHYNHDDVIVDVSCHSGGGGGGDDREESQQQGCSNGEESGEQSLHGAASRTSVSSSADSSTRPNRTRRINVPAAVGWPIWFHRFSSNSTGHIVFKHQQNWENFTLRVPEDVRTQIMSGKLNSQCFVRLSCPPARRGYRFSVGDDGSCRGGRLSVSSNPWCASKSDRWAFSGALPFFSSRRSSKVASTTMMDGGNNKADSSTIVNSSKCDEEANAPDQVPV